VYEAQADGHNLRRLGGGSGGRGPSAHDPTFSPDGRRVAWVESTTGHSALNVVKLGDRTVQTFDFPQNTSHPAWTADATSIAVLTSTDPPGTPGDVPFTIALLSVTSGERHTLVGPTTVSPLDPPSWSPDGRLLLYVVKAGPGRYEIRVAADGSPSMTVAAVSSDLTAPTWVGAPHN
jgi:Tol biopolymer transport system component